MILPTVAISSFVASADHWTACSSPYRQSGPVVNKHILVEQKLKLNLPKNIQRFAGARKTFHWRNDEQIDKICKKDSSTFVRLFNEMPPIQLRRKARGKKLTIFLDLDETLFNRPEDESTGLRTVFFNPLREIEIHSVKMRPFADQFLGFLSKHAELYAWTMSGLSRAETLLTVHDVKHHFRGMITREDVTKEIKLPDIHVKAIEKTFDSERGYENTLHVDDRAGTFLLNQLNGIRIGRFQSRDDDRQMLEFIKVFKWIFKCFDITQHVQDCVATLKELNPAYFDGLQNDEYDFEPAHHLAGYLRYTEENMNSAD